MNSHLIVDLHCDTLLELRFQNKHLSEYEGHITPEKLCIGNSLLQSFAVFTPTNRIAERHQITDSPLKWFHDTVDLFDREITSMPELFMPVRNSYDIRKAPSQNKISALLTMEDCTAADGNLSNLQTFYDRGVRMIGLIWNYENCMGYPSSNSPVEHARGLKSFGLESVAEMNRLGIIIDVSHLSEGGFWDVYRNSSSPFIASHSCARSLCDHRRNLTDRQLMALAERGGICGVNFCSFFLEKGSDFSTNEQIVHHMRYIADVAGIDTVAIGSDFDGIECGLEMKDYSGFPGLIAAMEKEFSPSEIDKICYQNALRVFADVLHD